MEKQKKGRHLEKQQKNIFFKTKIKWCQKKRRYRT